MFGKIKYLMMSLIAVSLFTLTSCKSEVEERIDLMEEVADVLSEVNDKDSADAAADDLADMIEVMNSWGKEDPEMTEEEKKQAEDAMGKMMKEMIRISMMDCYGSEKLKKAMK